MSIFNSVLVKKPGRSLFNLSHERKFSCQWANLYPILCTECVPGDTFKVSTELLVRTAPLIAPVMHRVNVKVHYFFVPNRLLWSSWEDFITGVDQSKFYEDENNSNGYFVNPVPPYISLTPAQANTALKDGTLADFLGYPTHRPDETVEDGLFNKVPLLPFLAYHKIYDDWYRNQNVEAPTMPTAVSDGINANLNYLQFHKKMWEKDYFTSALPFAQRGDPVDIPWNPSALKLQLNQYGDVTYVRPKDSSVDIVDNSKLEVMGERHSSDSLPAYGLVNSDNTTAQPQGIYPFQVDVTGHTDIVNDSSVPMATINDLRVATRLQRWLEKNARVGGRYIEQILAHFGIHSSDARLQRAEYLGGWTNPIVISDIEQNSSSESWTVDSDNAQSTTTSTPQGTLAGKGTSYGSSKPVKCFCEEHGFLIGIMSILPRTSYQDQLSKMWQRTSRYDYYFPEFAHLGEQEVNKAEVYYDVTSAANQSKDRFGFQERYCEYKYIPSSVHGEFKGNLDFWHLGREFPTQPALNKSFVTANPDNRIFAVTDNSADHFYVNLINHVSALRPMPKQAIPTL